MALLIMFVCFCVFFCLFPYYSHTLIVTQHTKYINGKNTHTNNDIRPLPPVVVIANSISTQMLLQAMQDPDGFLRGLSQQRQMSNGERYVNRDLDA